MTTEHCGQYLMGRNVVFGYSRKSVFAPTSFYCGRRVLVVDVTNVVSIHLNSGKVSKLLLHSRLSLVADLAKNSCLVTRYVPQKSESVHEHFNDL